MLPDTNIISGEKKDDPLAMYAGDIMTVSIAFLCCFFYLFAVSILYFIAGSKLPATKLPLHVSKVLHLKQLGPTCFVNCYNNHD